MQKIKRFFKVVWANVIGFFQYFIWGQIKWYLWERKEVAQKSRDFFQNYESNERQFIDFLNHLEIETSYCTITLTSEKGAFTRKSAKDLVFLSGNSFKFEKRLPVCVEVSEDLKMVTITTPEDAIPKNGIVQLSFVAYPHIWDELYIGETKLPENNPLLT